MDVESRAAGVRAAFDAIDADSDGELSRSELRYVISGLLGPETPCSEIDDAVNAAFARLDKDMNGSISFAEFSAATVREPCWQPCAATAGTEQTCTCACITANDMWGSSVTHGLLCAFCRRHLPRLPYVRHSICSILIRTGGLPWTSLLQCFIA